MVNRKFLCGAFVSILLAFLLSISFTLLRCSVIVGDTTVTYESKSDSNISVGSNKTSSERGVTYTQKVPFAKETISEIKEREAKKPISIPKQKAIPFLKEPPPKELPRELLEYKKPSEIKPQDYIPYKPVEALKAPALSNNFIGLDDNNTTIPPDTNGAAGTDYLVEALNSEVAFFNKSTGSITSSVTLQAFWASLGTAYGEPAYAPFDTKVIYDQHSGRFILVTMGGHNTYSPYSWLLIAVSETSDPTGTWYKWAIDADVDAGVQTYNNWADYPGLGVDANYVYVSANMYDNASKSTYQYGKVWVIPKIQLLSGTNSGTSNITLTEFRDPLGSGPTMQPAHVFGQSSAQYLIHQGYGTGTDRFFRISKITFTSDAPTWTDLGYIRVTPYPRGDLPEAPQLGSTKLINTGDERLLNAVLRNGYIWTTHTVANDANTKTEVAWYQINPPTASPAPIGTPLQQGRISDTNRWYYYPSIAVSSNNDIGIGFSGSSASEYASAYYTARQSSDTTGTMQSVATLKTGLASYYKTFSDTRNRWGDYSATCVDPNDDLTFWTVQEYASTPAITGTNRDRWGTWWGKFTFTSIAAPPTIACGGYHSIALKSDGTVWAWGDNQYGQLGDGTNMVDRIDPVQVSGLSGITAIAGGRYHTIALKSDGTVWAWGYNRNGELGDGTYIDRTTPVQVSGLSGITAIAGGVFHSIALKSDGTVWAWGDNRYGQLGDGTYTKRNTPVQVIGLSGVSAIAGGQSHSLARKSDGTVWAWGDNGFGQLGDGTFTNSATPVQVRITTEGVFVSFLSGVSAIACGGHHSIALKSDGTVWTWGWNDYCQLGYECVIYRASGSYTPDEVIDLSGVTAIAGGYEHTLSMKSDGTVWAWGGNGDGQLGNWGYTLSGIPLQVEDLNLIVSVTPTPTTTATPIPISSPTTTPTAITTATPTATKTQTPTPIVTSTVTPTPASTPTPTPSPTADNYKVKKSLMTGISSAEFSGEYAGCKTPREKTIFYDTDPFATIWFSYENAEVGDTSKRKWYSPNGSLYATGTSTYSKTSSCKHAFIRINGTAAETKLGQWQVKVFRNDQLSFTKTFTIQKALATPTPSPTPTPTATATPTVTKTPTLTATPTIIITPIPCEPEVVSVSPIILKLNRNKSSDVTVTVTGSDDCVVEGETVTATINPAGKKRVLV